jgi:SAM-dependent methyltransferase
MLARLSTLPEVMPDRIYLQPYVRAIKAHGASFEATLWRSPESQAARFRVMLDLAPLDDAVIVDVGCGRGDFAAFLHQDEVPFRRYIGLDALPEMIDAAANQAMPRCEFHVADVLANPHVVAQHRPDVVCISGTLNTMDQAAARRLVRASFDAARKSVIFNFLSDQPHEKWMESEAGPALRFDTIAWLHWSLSLASRVSFTQDYLDGHDATIMISHGEE